MARIGVNALYLIPGGVGGTEIYLRELLAALATHRYAQRIFCLHESGNRPGPDAAAGEFPLEAASRARALRARRGFCGSRWCCRWKPARYRLDVMFNPGFTAPAGCSVSLVTMFHDLQHKRYPEYFRWFDLPFWKIPVVGRRRTVRGR